MDIFINNHLVDWSKSRFFQPKTDPMLECPCCAMCAPTQGLIDLINQVRIDFGKAILINSGTRCTKHNDAKNGKPQSYHIAMPVRGVYSQALDIRPEHYEDLHKLVKVCEIYLMNKGGLIIYPTFIHIDTRLEKYRA